MTNRGRRALALASALLVSATDPTGDVGSCPPGGASPAGDARIDIVEARGEIVEQGTALRFTVELARAIEVPDREGTPLRIDVVLRDPSAPTVDFRYYHGLNRIVRFDAVDDPVLQIVLLPEQGANVFVGAVALGTTVTMTLPGRLVTRDLDLEGLQLRRMRWGVIARDEDECDAVGAGRPTERLLVAEDSTPSPTAPATASPGSTPSGAGGEAGDGSAVGWLVGAGIIAAAWALTVVVRRRPRRP